MCGFSGCLGSNNWVNKEKAHSIVTAMNRSIEHRGRDGSGVYLDVNNGLLLGHQRLSIIDIEGGVQPLTDIDGRATIVFNGEIYNYKQLRKELTSLGNRFKTKSDTEVLLLAYLQWGDSCLTRLRGMFAFAIWDQQKKKLFCARDRAGIKPFYYYWDGKFFIFASEIKAILQHPKVRVSKNLNALSHYLQFQYIKSPETIYDTIFKLPAAHSLLLQSNKLILNQYWNINSIDIIDNISESEAIEKVSAILEESVLIHLNSDAPLGAFLSGGVDSAAIVALMEKNQSKPLSTYTAKFNNPFFDESIEAKNLANFYKTNHIESVVDINISEDFEKIIYHLDEPFADASAIPTYYLCREASLHVKVCLSGDGGDELFAGYNWYSELLKLQSLQNQLPHFMASGISSLLRHTLPSTYKGAEFIKNLGYKPEQQHINLMSYFGEQELAKLCNFSLIDSSIDKYEKSQISNKTGDIIKDAQRYDFETYLSEDILMKVDKMSMAHGLEVRVPLLDHHVVEAAMGIPTRYMINKNKRKIVFKKGLKNLVPEATLNRKKKGFSAPINQWLNGELNEQFGDLLLSPNSKGSAMFDRKQVEILWKKSQNSSIHVGINEKLWTLFCFEMWQSVYQ